MTRIRGRTGSGSNLSDSADEGDGSGSGGGAFVSSVSRLSSRAVGGAAGGMDEDKLRRYKTVMCQRLSGPDGCKYGVHCDLSVTALRHTAAPLMSSHFHRRAGAVSSRAVWCVVLCCVVSALTRRTSCVALSTVWPTRRYCAL